MENSADKRNSTSANPNQKEDHKITKIKSSRRPGDKKEKTKKTSYKEHKNPIIRSIARTGYTVWLVVMGIGIVLAFIVSVFVL